jgi:hypothetical protein
MAQVTLTQRKGSRTCEENLARRAWASAYDSQPAQLKQHLRHVLPLLDSPRPLYRRMAKSALAQDDQKQLQRALEAVLQEIDHCRANRRKVTTLLPLLYA